MAYYVIKGLGRSERCQKIPENKLRIFDSTNLSGLLVSLFTPFGEPKPEKTNCFMKDPQDGTTGAFSDEIQKLRNGIKRYIEYYLNSNSEKLKKHAHVLNEVLNFIKINVTDKQIETNATGDVNKKTQQKLKKQDKKSCDQEETTDAIRNLAEYCLKNSLLKPIFQTNNLGKKGPNKKIKVVVAKLGKFEFVATGRLETATKDAAAIGLLNLLQKLDFEEVELIRTESRLPNAKGKLQCL